MKVDLDSPSSKVWMKKQLERLAAEFTDEVKSDKALFEARLGDLAAKIDETHSEIEELFQLKEDLQNYNQQQGLLAGNLKTIEKTLTDHFDALLGLGSRTQKLEKEVGDLKTDILNFKKEKTKYTINQYRWTLGILYAYEGLKPDALVRSHAIGIVAGFRFPSHFLAEPHVSLAIPFGGATGEIVGGDPSDVALETINDLDFSGFCASAGAKLGYEGDRGFALFGSLDVRTRKLWYRHASYESFSSDWTTEGVSSLGFELRFKRFIFSMAAGFVWASRIRLPEYAYNLEGTSLHVREGANDSWQFFIQPALLFGFDE